MNYFKKILFLSLLCSFFSCENEPNLGEDIEKSAFKLLKESDIVRNYNLRKIAENLSKSKDSDVFEKISTTALKKYDGDNNFIYNKDKKILKKESLNNLEKDVDIEELSNPYLNIYVYKPYDKTIDNLKPYVFYFPVGQKDTEVNELIGFFNGKEIKIDAQNPPINIENPIFVIGENERIHEIKESNDVSFSVKNKTYSARPPYFEEDNGEGGSTGGGSTGGGTNTSGEMKVTYSRFISMSAKRFYEPWGKGDAEVRFIFTKSGYIKRNMVSINPITDLEVETSTALIDGGYMRQSWWNFYSIDNNKQTAPFVDFTPFDIGNWSNPKTTVYSMRIIEEDKYWGWVGWLLDETRNTKINFVDFKTVFLNNLNITPQNIVEPSVRTIYNSMVNANDRDTFMAAFNQLKVDTNFYFNTSANNYINLETNIKTSLALAGVNLLNQVLLANENTDDQIGTDIEIINQNNKLYYSSDGRFKFKLSY